MMASRMESEIWSAILSGCPSVTDSDVKRCRPLRLMPSSCIRCPHMRSADLQVRFLGRPEGLHYVHWTLKTVKFITAWMKPVVDRAQPRLEDVRVDLRRR